MAKRLIIILLAVSLLILGAPLTAFAWEKECPERPGWGYGDENHCHTGPPGLGFPFPWEIDKFPNSD